MDIFRQFGTKCASCERVIHATDWVRRARSLVFHLACFVCDQCKRLVLTIFTVLVCFPVSVRNQLRG